MFDVIALASRAFALFYMLQCAVAGWAALAAPGVSRRRLHVAWFCLLALVAAVVVIFGIPAEGG